MAEQKNFLALLFDTRSIQRYIYSGNKLRTNIGASFIVDRLFDDILIGGVLKAMFRADKFPNDDIWDESRDTLEPWTEFEHCCVAYVGGGNALLLFDPSKEDRRVEVTEKFTRKLLVERPGLRVGAAQGTLNFDPETRLLNQNDISKLYAALKRNQNNVFPAVNVPYTGLTLSCEVNGEAANAIYHKDGVRFFSQEVRVKLDAADDANLDLKRRFEDIFELKNLSKSIVKYDFPTQFEDLGQIEGNDYFAIVHVDGNNMGVKFNNECKTLSDRRKLSREIKRKTEGAFAALLDRIIKMIENDGFGKLIKLKGNYLPIRPIIIGGDDITFVCPATVALMFTNTLMELMNDAGIDCCSGITILPTAYPFFRGYELTEELCGAAKKTMRALNSNKDSEKSRSESDSDQKIIKSCWLDFAILHGEQAPTLDQIREREYRGARGDMHFGPYRVDNRDEKSPKERRHNIENLFECTAQFMDSKRIARNKVKELRDVLQHGRDDAARFFQQLGYQNQSLPELDDWRDYATDYGWSAEREPHTPYIDAIELTDFYSAEVMKQWQTLT